MSTIRWGILSTSRHAGRSVIPAIHASASGEALAVASRDPDRAQSFAAEHGLPTIYGDYDALLNDPAIDAIYIPLPNHLHKKWTLRALRAGKHVLCEKPLSLNAAEAQEMVAAARAADRLLVEAFQWRYHPQAQRLRVMVRAGVIGPVRLLDAGFSFPLDRDGDIRWEPDMGGGAVYDVGCYPISFARFVTGQEPQAVTAQAQWTADGVDALLVATLQFADGVVGHVNASFLLPLRKYYEVVGETGMLRVRSGYNLKEDQPGEVLHYGPDYAEIERIALKPANSYTLMVEDVNRAILEGRDAMFPPEDAIGNMRVIDAVLKAAREGGTVRL